LGLSGFFSVISGISYSVGLDVDENCASASFVMHRHAFLEAKLPCRIHDQHGAAFRMHELINFTLVEVLRMRPHAASMLRSCRLTFSMSRIPSHALNNVFL